MLSYEARHDRRHLLNFETLGAYHAGFGHFTPPEHAAVIQNEKVVARPIGEGDKKGIVFPRSLNKVSIL